MPQPILVTRTGTSWTIDVTALSLSTNLTFKDFAVYAGGILLANSNFTKTTATVLTYNGAPLTANTAVQVYRDSSLLVDDVVYNQVNSSASINALFTQVERALEDLRIFAGAPIVRRVFQSAVVSGATPLAVPLAVPAQRENYVEIVVSLQYTASAAGQLTLTLNNGTTTYTDVLQSHSAGVTNVRDVAYLLPYAANWTLNITSSAGVVTVLNTSRLAATPAQA
jgi:hypothetical protein